MILLGDEMKLDLHTHTYYSDGSLSVGGNVLKAGECGLDGVAITDHNTIVGWEELDETEYPIMTIKGVEISTQFKEDSVHILGYYLNDGGDYSLLDSLLKQRYEEEMRRLRMIISKLEYMDIILTEEEVIEEAEREVTRRHIAQTIFKKYPKLGLSAEEIFQRYVGSDSPAYVPRFYFPTDVVIDVLHDSHCLAILAHPLFIRKFDFREMKDLGIDGMEGIYPYRHCSFDISPVMEFCDSTGLMVTGGSDYHGPHSRTHMGESYIEEERAKIFLKKISY